MDRRSSLVLLLAVSALGGCSPKENHDTEATSISTDEPITTGNASTTEPTGASDTVTGGGTTGSSPSANLFGTFHPQEYTDGQKWEQGPNGENQLIWWGNVTIDPDSTLTRERYFCGELTAVQSFSWESDGDKIRVVPPSVPFLWAGSEAVEVTIAPAELCGEILITMVTPSDKSYTSTWVPGHLCSFDSQQQACVFEFKWCESPPEPPVCN